jgi:phosphoribosylanthranilate isomerase
LAGTGRVHDWQVSRAIRDAVGVPLFLAGGLRAENVADAVRTVRPFGIDVCSGVRRDGKLDRSTLTEFMAAVHSASEIRRMSSKGLA